MGSCLREMPVTEIPKEMNVLRLVTQLYLTLCNPMYYNPPGFSVQGILQARRLE